MQQFFGAELLQGLHDWESVWRQLHFEDGHLQPATRLRV
jgi:hypothetical protein